MIQPYTTEQRNANRIANLIERNAELYASSPIFKMMVDNTVFFTDEERQHSMGEVGPEPRSWKDSWK